MVVVKRIQDVAVDLASDDMREILDEEYLRIESRLRRQDLKPISQSRGDIVELTGDKMENFGFPAQKGQLAKITGVYGLGYVGTMLIVDNDGDIVETKFTSSQVRTVQSRGREFLN